MNANLQVSAEGKLKHLLTTEGLPPEILLQILDTARSFVSVTEREVKKVPLLRGKAIFNLFFEASTRTRTTFEIAAKRLSADVINLNIATSSQTKGERLLDTVANLTAMHADMFIVRLKDMPCEAVSSIVPLKSLVEFIRSSICKLSSREIFVVRREGTRLTRSLRMVSSIPEMVRTLRGFGRSIAVCGLEGIFFSFSDIIGVPGTCPCAILFKMLASMAAKKSFCLRSLAAISFCSSGDASSTGLRHCVSRVLTL